MDRSTQTDLALRFRALHDRKQVLLLPNAWDAASACIFADLGFPAIATTSGGVAWSLGYADGEATPLPEVLAAIRRMTRVLRQPLTVDFEAGFGATAQEVGEHVRALIEAGAVGINLEDGVAHASLRTPDDAAARIAAAREAAAQSGVPLFINARVDNWIIGGDTPAEDRLADALARARAYLAAGADGIYPIALADAPVIARFCREIDAPINIGARAGLPPLPELGRLGVARVSTATRLAAVAFSAARDAARRVLDSGGFESLDAPFGYPDLQRLFTRD